MSVAVHVVTELCGLGEFLLSFSSGTTNGFSERVEGAFSSNHCVEFSLDIRECRRGKDILNIKKWKKIHNIIIKVSSDVKEEFTETRL